MTPQPVFGLGEIGQIGLTVTDLARAVEFYRDKLGMRGLFQVPGLAFFDCQGIRLMLSAAEKAGETSSVLYYRVPNIHTGYNELLRRGVSFEREPHLVARMPDHELWMAFFRDPDRNLMALMSELR